jgi:sulfur-oxidizing protein SoxY
MIQRRTFLKGTMSAGMVGAAVSAGLLAPRAVWAAWPESAFAAKSVDDVAKGLNLTGGAEDAGIEIKAPDIAENGAVVPISVVAKGAADEIAILVDGNGTPLVANHLLSNGAVANISVRAKMGKTSNVIAIVKAGGKVTTAKKEVKVTIGGCGG